MCIIDTNFTWPAVYASFGLGGEPGRGTLNQVLWEGLRLAEAVYRVNVWPEQQAAEPVYIVPAVGINGIGADRPRKVYPLDALTDVTLNLYMLLGLDVLLIDTFAGVSDDSLLPMALADTLAVVLRPDQQDYYGSAVSLEVARKLECCKPWWLRISYQPRFLGLGLKRGRVYFLAARLRACFRSAKTWCSLAAILCLLPGTPITRLQFL